MSAQTVYTASGKMRRRGRGLATHTHMQRLRTDNCLQCIPMAALELKGLLFVRLELSIFQSYLSVRLSFSLSVCPCVCLLFVYAYMSVRPSVCLFSYLPVSLSVFQSNCQPVSPSAF